MDIEFYDFIEEKLKNEFLKKEKINKKKQSKYRRLQRIRQRNRAIIKAYVKKFL